MENSARLCSFSLLAPLMWGCCEFLLCLRMKRNGQGRCFHSVPGNVETIIELPAHASKTVGFIGGRKAGPVAQTWKETIWNGEKWQSLVKAGCMSFPTESWNFWFSPHNRPNVWVWIGAVWPLWNQWLLFFCVLAANVILVEAGAIKIKVVPVICNAGARGVEV
jgi:hypothetical protein